MWKDSPVSRRLKLDAPIVQGPFGSGLSSVDLVIAVSEGGGLGSFGVHHLDGAGMRDIAAQIRARTARSFALNLWIPLADSDDPQMSDAEWRAALAVLAPYYQELGVPLPARPALAGPTLAISIPLPTSERNSRRLRFMIGLLGEGIGAFL